MNDASILDAMATHLIALTPPSGYAVRKVHAMPPENLGVVPAIVLLPAGDSVSVGSGNKTTVLTVNIVAYLQQVGGMGRKYRDLHTFRAWLRSSFDQGLTLDGDAVMIAITQTALGTDQWAEQDYITCTATAEVTAYEPIGFTA